MPAVPLNVALALAVVFLVSVRPLLPVAMASCTVSIADRVNAGYRKQRFDVLQLYYQQTAQMHKQIIWTQTFISKAPFTRHTP